MEAAILLAEMDCETVPLLGPLGIVVKTSPTQRSTKYLRDQGFIVAKVEKWNQYAMVRQDVFGFGDLLIAKEGYGIALVQTTSRSNLNARMVKAREIPEFDLWLRAGGKVLFHGWSRRGPRGKRKTWQVEERES